MERKEVWCLFSKEDNYDQPRFNLEYLWLEKPDFIELCKALDVSFQNPEGDKFVSVADILKGGEAPLEGIIYQLEAMKVGT